MPAADRPPRPHRRLAAALAVLAALALVGAAVALAAGGSGGSAAKATPKVRLHAAQNATLGKRIVVTAKGRTLYTLSAEHDGRFICTDDACLALWKPLVLRHGAQAVGVAHLGAVKRPEPDGRRQATYKGHPLYTFTQDHAKGDVNGEGFKDVGTWRAARAPKQAKKAKPKPQPAPPSGGYGY